jgi:hypothetical protein
MMPALTFTKHENVDYFPFGIRTNDYALVRESPRGNYQLISPWLEGLLPSDTRSREQLQSCFVSALKESRSIARLEEGGGTYHLLKLRPTSVYTPYP